MSTLFWYWHRLRAMGAREVWHHARRKGRQYADSWTRPPQEGSGALELTSPFPALPDPADAPSSLREALAKDLKAILAGQWHAFGHLPIRVDDPPRWQRDYLAGVEVPAQGWAFGLDHRHLPHGADIKLIWELSRWYQPARLAMAARVLDHGEAGRKCVAWLEDWVHKNPPYRGWNWTSALEAGLRLIQFTWIHALLSASRCGLDFRSALDRLCRILLPAHARFVWRYRSFGSSANNHLLGELAGLIVATARWPALASRAASLDRLHPLWEREVLMQFAPDGGNREQALNYHLFSFEFCWQTRAALRAAGRTISPEVEERLGAAADFYAQVQVQEDPWDYGDSDGACVVWLGAAASGVREWCQWCQGPDPGSAVSYWLGPAPAPPVQPRWRSLAEPWRYYPETGQAICRSGPWILRWDLSPLGYLATAAHGHLDALHLSLWLGGVALVVDPGTGAYYADTSLRQYLASWAAHNGPCPAGLDYPRRLGPFLWSETHATPSAEVASDGSVSGRLALPEGMVQRVVRCVEHGRGWQVEDHYVPRSSGADAAFSVSWQVAPGATLEPVGPGRYRLGRRGVALVMEVDSRWAEVRLVVPQANAKGADGEGWDEQGLCSPGFRQRAVGPRLCLRAHGHNPCLLRTTFLACAD